VLILTSEHAVAAVSTYRERIESHYRIALPPPDTVQILADKVSFQAFAEREHFPVPSAIAVCDETDLPQLSALAPPLILKPADKILVEEGVVERTARADTVEEARIQAARMLRRARSVIVQEWIEGADEELFFTLFTCDRRGQIMGMFTGRKLLCSPPGVGYTAVCVAAPEAAAELEALARALVVRTGYRGLGGLEFKRQTGSGRFLMIEPTVGRTDWQEEIASLHGVNLPLLTYCAELGEPLPAPLPPRDRLAWRSSRQYRVRPAIAGPRLHVVDGHFRWSDPLPGLYFYAYERGAVRFWRGLTRLIRVRPVAPRVPQSLGRAVEE
jgi:predicted ATP-grasp superfamily ATP-dependent carboligase